MKSDEEIGGCTRGVTKSQMSFRSKLASHLCLIFESAQ